MTKRTRIKQPTAQHQLLHKELVRVMKKFGDMPALEMLACAAQFTGQIMAYQDQRTVTPQYAMETVMTNLMIGNRAAVAILMNEKGPSDAKH